MTLCTHTQFYLTQWRRRRRLQLPPIDNCQLLLLLSLCSRVAANCFACCIQPLHLAASRTRFHLSPLSFSFDHFSLTFCSFLFFLFSLIWASSFALLCFLSFPLLSVQSCSSLVLLCNLSQLPMLDGRRQLSRRHPAMLVPR